MFSVPDIYDNIRLNFNEELHKYTDTYGNEYMSVTQLLHSYKPAFDHKYWLHKKANELGISEKALAKQWQNITDEACDRGTRTHSGLEAGIKDASMFKDAVIHVKRQDNTMVTVADIAVIDDYIKPLVLDDFVKHTENKYPKIYEVFDYYISGGYKIYSEVGAFLPSVLVSGTIDVLILREDQFVIGDWKTNRGGLKFESGYYRKDKSCRPHQLTNQWVAKNDTLLPPLTNLPDCNGSLYNLQLSVYSYMAESVLGVRNAGVWLCHIDSDFELNQYGMPRLFPDGTYRLKENPVEKTTMYRMKYLREEVGKIMSDRLKVVAAGKIRNKTLFD